MNIQRIVQIIISLIVLFLVAALLHYLIVILPIPAPYQAWTILALKVLVVLALIAMLLDWAGYPLIRR